MPPRADHDGVLLELVGEVMGLLELDELCHGLLDALLRAVPSKWASLNEVGPQRVLALVQPHLDEVWIDRFAKLAHENPIYQRFMRTRDGRAYRFRDVGSREDLEATTLYREIYKPLGIEYQIAFALAAEPDRMLAVVMHREDRDFTDDERDFLNDARPYLVQAYSNAIAYSELRSRSSESLQEALVEHGLTAREAEVLQLVALGRSSNDVGTRLGVSNRTVQKHLEHAYRKLGVHTRSEAAERAWELAGDRPPQPPMHHPSAPPG